MQNGRIDRYNIVSGPDCNMEVCMRMQHSIVLFQRMYLSVFVYIFHSFLTIHWYLLNLHLRSIAIARDAGRRGAVLQPLESGRSLVYESIPSAQHRVDIQMFVSRARVGVHQLSFPGPQLPRKEGRQAEAPAPLECLSQLPAASPWSWQWSGVSAAPRAAGLRDLRPRLRWDAMSRRGAEPSCPQLPTRRKVAWPGGKRSFFQGMSSILVRVTGSSAGLGFLVCTAQAEPAVPPQGAERPAPSVSRRSLQKKALLAIQDSKLYH